MSAVDINAFSEGNDGPWSSFFLRVGTPQQYVRALVSTVSPETLVVSSGVGCSSAAFRTAQGQADVPSDCPSSRGLLFQANASSTWLDEGLYGINDGRVGLEANLGYTQAAEFGLETLGTGLLSGSSGGPALPNQTVAIIGTASPFYLGILGLGTQPVNFTTLGNVSAPSYFTSLKTQGYIPSLSWSYTAGAIYRLREVYGQLIFGGYDASRFVENDVVFTMAGDVTRDLVVALQSITYSGGSSGESQSLLATPVNIFIDSTDPFLWLPADACAAFEAAFGLELDVDTGLYLVNSTHHTTLLGTDAQVALQLSDVLQGGATVTVVLPYQAFDLQVSSPLVANGTSYYFPLKKAANSTQYTLGRTFLQEAYLSTDYERGVFNVSQCAWVEGAASTIVPIAPLASTGTSGGTSPTSSGVPSQPSSSTSTKSHSLGAGVIAVVVVGVVAALGLALGVWALWRRQLRKKTAAAVLAALASRNGGQEQPPDTADKKVLDDETAWAIELGDGLDDALSSRSPRPNPEPRSMSVRHSELSADTAIYQMSDSGTTDGMHVERFNIPSVIHEIM
ncbi:hypothetical protein SCUCBS95973_001610 [Sporothrix curviconia]|uniref:Peptidase A1 domain-containing protein n=1 Tax=Sporothrix curviconia TaxID=1260050 RepID=A0ABP0B0L3_9PEZI